MMATLIGFAAGSIGKKDYSKKEKSEVLKQNCDSVTLLAPGDSLLPVEFGPTLTDSCDNSSADEVAIANLELTNQVRESFITEEPTNKILYFDTG